MKYLYLPKITLCSIVFLFAACNPAERKQVGLPDKSVQKSPSAAQFSIKRYEKALFEIPGDRFQEGINEIIDEYGVFFGTDQIPPEAINQLKAFVSNRQNQEIYAECLKRFPDLTELSADFKNAFTRIRREIPEFTEPQVYTYVSGFDFQYPVKYADSALIIALDMYLGSDYAGYANLGIPLYISERQTPLHILPDCMKEISLPLIKSNKTPNLLDAMIEEGKTLYFTDLILPETSDHLKIGFTKTQYQWCTKNENNIWSFLIENELLYSSDARSMSMFMTDGPFTASFSQESPARTGAWLGWQIVKAYAGNTKTGLKELMLNTNSQEILEKSGYKPRKK